MAHPSRTALVLVLGTLGVLAFLQAAPLVPSHAAPSAEASPPLVPLGPNFPIAIGTDEGKGKPGVAHDGTNFAVAWTRGADVFLTRVTPDGVLVDVNGISVSVGQNEAVDVASVAFDGTNYLVAWIAQRAGTTDIYGARVTPGGIVLDGGANLRLTTGGNPKFRMPAMAFGGSRYLLAWRTESDEIRGILVSKDGVNLSAPAGVQIAQTFTSYYPSAAFDGTNFLVTWHDSRNVDQSGWDIYGARVAQDGQVLDPNGFVICDEALHQEHNTVAFDGTNYVVAWYDWRPNGHQTLGRIYAARVAPDGTVLDTPAMRVAELARGQIPPQVACGAGECLVAWSLEYGEAAVAANFRLTDVYARRISRAGELLDVVPVSTSWGHQFGPIIGEGGGRYLVAWTESTGRQWSPSIYAQVLGPAAEGDADRAGAGARPAVVPGAAASDMNRADLRTATHAPWVSVEPRNVPETSGSMTPSAHASAVTTGALAAGRRARGGELAGAWTTGPAGTDGAGAPWTTQPTTMRASRSVGLALTPSDVYSFGQQDIGRLVNGTWQVVGDWLYTYGGWAAAHDNIWIAGWCRGFAQWNGQVWNPEGCYASTDGDGVNTGVWGSSATDMWASSTGGDLYRFDGVHAWFTVPSGQPYDLQDVWGTSASNVYAVGERGTILRYDGSTWSPVGNVPATHTLNAVWGTGPSDIFVVGDWGTILHYDGSSWTPHASPTERHLFSVWGTSGSDVFAVGLFGTVLHYDGTSWSVQETGSTQHLLHVWGVVDGQPGTRRVWAAGEGTTILTQTEACAATRVIGLDGDLAFGQVDVGASATRTLRVTNTGNALVTVTGIDYPGGFSGAWSGTIPAGRAQQVTVRFAPSAPGSFQGTITVHADVTGGTNTIPVSGAGTAPPPPACTSFSIGPSSVNTGHAAGSQVVTITGAPAGCAGGAWTAIGNGSWLRVAPASGSGSATATVSWTENRSLRPRSATAAVAGSGFTVNQAGASVAPAPGDFDGDRRADIVWRNRSTGEAIIWFMSGAARTGYASVTPLTSDPSWRIDAVGDFDGDGRPDLFWRNSVSGRNVIWFMNGAARQQSAEIPPLADMRWALAGAGDLNGDGRADLVWRQGQNGANCVWFMNGAASEGGGPMTGVPDTGWIVGGIADFNGDLRDDIVWRHATTGENLVWFMSGTSRIGYERLPAAADGNWRIVQAADFGGDGKPDLLWRHVATGENLVWRMNGTAFLGYDRLRTVADTNWDVMRPPLEPADPLTASWDFNGDGASDVLWRNQATGENVLWLMRGAAQVGNVRLNTIADSSWRAAVSADVDGNGHTDIVWRNAATGENIAWLMDCGVQPVPTGYVRLPSVPGADWRVSAAADFDQDGKADFVWRNQSTGENIVWFMSGVARTGYARLVSVADAQWQIAGAADFTLDGRPDLLWRNGSTGENVVWEMNGAARVAALRLPPIADTAWRAVQVGDFNADGKPDVLWRHATSGENIIWYLNGTSFVAYKRMATVPVAWVVGQ